MRTRAGQVLAPLSAIIDRQRASAMLLPWNRQAARQLVRDLDLRVFPFRIGGGLNPWLENARADRRV
jgi:hypothetical protein